MVDILQVLEGATYAAFIVGAIVAVFELRSISRDRRAELLIRSQEMFCSRDMEQAAVNAVIADMQPGKVADVDAKMIADYFEFLGAMARTKLGDKDIVGYIMSHEAMWEWMHPWILSWEERVGEGRFPNFEWMANEERKKRLAAEQRAKAA